MLYVTVFSYLSLSFLYEMGAIIFAKVITHICLGISSASAVVQNTSER